jgi:hypothetical protein
MRARAFDKCDMRLVLVNSPAAAVAAAAAAAAACAPVASLQAPTVHELPSQEPTVTLNVTVAVRDVFCTV